MTHSDPRYDAFLAILAEELLPATGCTEPIAIAYGAAKAREVLGELPQSVLVEASGNIIKNVKSVVVPNTGGLTGIPAAVAAGLVAGRADRLLEVIAEVTPEQQAQIRRYLGTHTITVRPAAPELIFDITLTLYGSASQVTLRIAGHHTNIVRLEKDGVALPTGPSDACRPEEGLTDRRCLDIASALDFATTADLEDFRPWVERQIEYNYAIAQAGLQGDWGANVGRVLLQGSGDTKTRARAMAAAGSDARMSGCEMPVVILSGSGNQGITACVPVLVYAKALGVSRETALRAVLLSDLITIHLKTGIGRLSAYCGAVSAGCASGAAIAWLHGGGYTEIAHTLVNALAIVSGIVCDGAKPSCAAKIAAAVDAGILGYQMYQNGQQFHDGEGIVSKGVENTIRNVSRLGHDGMRATDQEIIRIMTDT